MIAGLLINFLPGFAWGLLVKWIKDGGSNLAGEWKGLDVRIPTPVAVYLVSPVWWGRALFFCKVDGFVPGTQHVNLRIVGQPEGLLVKWMKRQGSNLAGEWKGLDVEVVRNPTTRG